MIRLETTIKATDNAQHNDPQLALQTATAYFLIRGIPSSKHVFTTRPSFLDHPTSDQNSSGSLQTLSKASEALILFIFALMRIVCTGIFISCTRGIHYNLRHFSKISVGLQLSLIFEFHFLTSSLFLVVDADDQEQSSSLQPRRDIFLDKWNFSPYMLTLHTLIRF